MESRRWNSIAVACLVFAGATQAQNAHAQGADQKTQKDNAADAKVSTQVATRAARALNQGQSNEKFEQPSRIEDAYPLTNEADRAKSARLMQQLTVDLLSLFNQHKEAHWNVNGPLYLSLHEFYQGQADFYRTQADIFAERVLQLGYSVDGRYSTIARTSKIPDFPAGYVTDNESIKLLLDRVTVLQKEVYTDIRETNDSDPVTSNKLQDLAYFVDKNLWQLRIHLQKPGSLGQDLPWTAQQSRDRTNASEAAPKGNG